MGGGVCFILHKTLKSKLVNVILNSYIELIHISIQRKGGLDLHFFSCYRAPNMPVSTFFESLSNYFSQSLVSKYPSIFLGDINIDLLTNDSRKKNFIDLMGSYSFVNYNSTCPTRVTESSSSLIDVIFANSLAFPNLNCFHTLDTHMTDHLMILANYKKPKNTKLLPITKMIVDYSNRYHDQVEMILRNYSFNSMDNSSNFLYELHLLINLANSAYPFKKVFVNNEKHPWTTQKYLRLHSYYISVANSAKANPTLSGKAHQLRNKCNALAKTLKRSYFDKQVNINEMVTNPRKAWSIIKKVLPSKESKSIIDTVNYKGTNIHGSLNIANAFNEYFTDVIPNLLASHFNDKSSMCHCNPVTLMSDTFALEFYHPNIGDIYKALVSIKKPTSHITLFQRNSFPIILHRLLLTYHK